MLKYQIRFTFGIFAPVFDREKANRLLRVTVRPTYDEYSRASDDAKLAIRTLEVVLPEYRDQVVWSVESAWEETYADREERRAREARRAREQEEDRAREARRRREMEEARTRRTRLDLLDELDTHEAARRRRDEAEAEDFLTKVALGGIVLGGVVKGVGKLVDRHDRKKAEKEAAKARAIEELKTVTLPRIK